jgi:hypothetical protein
MQNKANLENDKMNINAFITTRYANLNTDSGKKTKPIQSQLKPIQTQFKPKQTQFKPNFKIPDRIYSLSSSENIYNANGSKCKRLDTLNILT